MVKLSTSKEIYNVEAGTDCTLLLIVDEFTTKPRVGFHFVNCYTHDQLKIVCAIPFQIKIFLNPDDVIQLKKVQLVDKSRLKTFVNRDIVFRVHHSMLHLLKRSGQVYQLYPKECGSISSAESDCSVVSKLASFKIDTKPSVSQYNGTLMDDFGVDTFNIDGEEKSYYYTRMLTTDSKELSIFVAKNVKLPMLLKEGHLIFVRGVEVVRPRETYFVVEKDKDLIFQGITRIPHAAHLSGRSNAGSLYNLEKASVYSG